MSTQRERLEQIRTASDVFTVSPTGEMQIDRCDVTDLLRRFGSPLYVIAEKTLRTNMQRIRRAFAALWPESVNVMYAIKANNNPAVRAILHSEGAGGDSFGLGELHATFLGGANPNLVAMNGSNKSELELAAAVQAGVFVNIDSEYEIEALNRVCTRLGRTARVNLRLKIIPDSYAAVGSDYFGLPTNVKACLEDEKWGFSPEFAAPLVNRITSMPRLQLAGFSAHTGRFTRDPALFREYTHLLATSVVRLSEETGFVADVLNIGGGWPRQRDPESRKLELNPHPIEEYASEAISGLREGFGSHCARLPKLWLEPGRYLVGNAVLLLGTVGAIKRDCGRIWVHADFSTNNLMRIDTAGSAYHVFAANGMDRIDSQEVQIVGPTCIDSRITSALRVPDLQMGEPLVVLDTGMYAETTSTQFNGMPRPASVLVSDGQAEVVKERETIEDLFRLCRIPWRLRGLPSANQS
jgi:diaminopimelate decarboxylase